MPREPMEGSSAVPGAGSLGGGGARPWARGIDGTLKS